MSAFFQAPDLLTSAGQAKDKSRQKPAARSQQWLGWLTFKITIWFLRYIDSVIIISIHFQKRVGDLKVGGELEVFGRLRYLK